MRKIRIDGEWIGDDSPAYVVAEIGHNHGGDAVKAMEMCESAKDCGCMAVKFQKRTNERIYTKRFLGTPYHSEHAFGETYGAHREALELGRSEYVAISEWCAEIGITWFATAFDEEAADFLEDLEVPCYKIASGDLRNLPLIRHVCRKGKPVLISTGGGSWDDIAQANAVVLAEDAQAVFLHCVARYPTPAEAINLEAITGMRSTMPSRVIGYSCHYNGILAATLAYVWGARVIEKHFTLDHTDKGSDHALSLQPEGMRRLVRDLDRIPLMIGNGDKTRNAAEETALAKMAKALWPTRSMPGGQILCAEDVASKSPTGPRAYRPDQLPDVLGKITVHDLSTDAPLEPEDLWGEP